MKNDYRMHLKDLSRAQLKIRLNKYIDKFIDVNYDAINDPMGYNKRITYIKNKLNYVL